jgi:endonuclease-3
MKKEIDWDAIMSALEAWRDSLGAGGAGEDPSVTTIAEKYRHDGWAVLVSTILSLRTKDAVTLAASRALLAKAPTPQALCALRVEDIEKLAYPAGFYKTKARNLLQIARILIEKHGGEPPADMDALLALPGVGRKTANLVLIEAYDMDGICVDTHVHRISNRAGWLSSKSPDATETALRELLPRRYWKKINLLLVLYGQRVCRPISPFCSTCALFAHCARRGVDKNR